jgi:long-chain-fatty-acyl-CoA reductase
MDMRLPLFVNGVRAAASPGAEHEIALRDGHRFLVPKLSDEMIEALAADDNPLAEESTDSIIAFLSNVGKNWKSDEYPRRRLYISNLVKFYGYSERQAREEANWIAMILCSHFRFRDLLKEELGHTKALDEWHHRDECQVRAFPLGTIFHNLAGNVPISGVVSIVRAMLTKNRSIVKPSSGDLLTPIMLMLSFHDVNPNHPVSKSCSIVFWPGDEADPAMLRRLLGGVDGAVIWGGDEAIAAIGAALPAEVPRLTFGHRESLSLILDIADGEEAAAVAERLAHDVAVYDQEACFSVQRVFIDRKACTPAFVAALAEAVGRYETLLPKREASFDQHALLSLRRHEEIFAGLEQCAAGDRNSWRIVRCSAGEVHSHPLARTLYLHPIDGVDEFEAYVGPRTQTVALHPWSANPAIRDRLARGGVQRLVELGMSNMFRVGAPHDGIFPLQRLVRWASVEDPSARHVKGIPMRVDQTRFLEEEMFERLIP